MLLLAKRHGVPHRRRLSCGGLRSRGGCRRTALARQCSGKGGDLVDVESAAATELEDGTPDVMQLEQALQEAVAREDYATAAKLRDELFSLNLAGEAGLIAVHRDFVAAQQARSLTKMEKVWHRGNHVCCVHLAQLPVFGHKEVVDSWKNLFREREAARVEPSPQNIAVRGSIGRIVAVDEKAKTVTTSVFERTPEGWKLWSHQVGTMKPQDMPSDRPGLMQRLPRWLRAAASAVRESFQVKRKKEELQPQTVRELQTISR